MALSGYAQSDTLLEKEIDPIFITAHRDGRKLSSLSTSVVFVSQNQINMIGANRVQQVLSEQNGIQIVPQVNGLGSGIQLQGFNPDYTLILLDGEPLVGRNTGLLDLNRLSLNAIKQIEIVKGPSSSLYGSEALAGVVNIITERTEQDHLKINLKLANNRTSDINATGGWTNKSTDGLVQVSRYGTDGYDLSPASFGKTVSPHQQWSGFSKFNANLGHHELSLSGRYFEEHQQSEYLVNEIATRGKGLINDWMINPVWKYKITPRLHSTLRTYYTQYSAVADYLKDKTNEQISSDDFHQSFTRVEWNPKYLISEKQTLLAGAGWVKEQVKTIRYGSADPQHQYTSYAFAQYTFKPMDLKEVNLGLRYDQNNVYGGQLSPKISFTTPIRKNITWNGSLGLGFKAPDFRQLYLDFNNAAGGGYSVLGREVLTSKLALLQQQGQIAGYLKDISNEGPIKPERSLSVNTGVHINASPDTKADLGIYYHNVSQLIETEPVAQFINGSNVFSYFNINKVRIEGAEANITHRINTALNICMGYQLLYALDLHQLELLKAGLKFRRDPVTLSSVRMKRSDYFGLSNRSRHSAQFKINYQSEKSPFTGSLRIIYRSKSGLGSNSGVVQGGEVFISERSGNDVLDRYDSFIKGYALTNINIGWNGLKPLQIQIGTDNVFNKTIPNALPGLSGRIVYLNLNYTFKGNGQ